MPEAYRPNADRLPPVPTQMVYAVRGTDRISGDGVETVVEAPSVDAARRIADQKSLEVADVTLMHPLNGAEALKAARINPNDRFNQPNSVTQLTPAPASPSAPEPEPTAPVITSPTPRPSQRPENPSAPSTLSQRPAGFSGPAPSDTRPQRSPIPGSVAAALVLAAMGGLLYFTVVRNQPDGAIGSLFAASPHRAAAVVTTPGEHAGPTDVDGLIAASRDPAPTTLLPRAQRRPGQTAYRVPPAPAPTPVPEPEASPTPPDRSPRAEAAAPFVLTSLTPGAQGQRATAVINGHVLRPGQSIGGHRLIQILDDSVVLERGGHLIGLGLTPPETAAVE